MQLSGKIHNIVFRNEDNGYTVLDIDAKGEMISVVGSFNSCYEGEEAEFTGEYKIDKKYGRQFVAKTITTKKPESNDGIIQYLSSGVIKGIGEVTATRIVAHFGKDTFDILEFNPKGLQEVKGITLKKAIEIGENFNEIKKMRQAVMFLQSYEITINMAMKIWNEFKNKTEELVRKNPYILVERIDGIGFKTADRIAQNIGIKQSSEFRMRAGILHSLKENADKNGHTFLPKDMLRQETFNLLNGYFDEVFNAAILSMKLDNLIKIFEIEGTEGVAMQRFYYNEQTIANKLNLLALSSGNRLEFDENELNHFEIVNKIKFHETQKDAIKMAFSSGVSVITGGPGTGKTTIVKSIITLLNNRKKKFLLLAPTGRAAKRMTDTSGYEAKTIHRGLEIDAQTGKFVHNENNKLEVDAIVCDETSMIDVNLFSALLRALKPDCKLVLVGDKNQLASVGAGNILSDVINSGVINTCNLTQIFRQSDDSKIITNSIKINSGEMPDMSNASSDFFFQSTENANESAAVTTGLVALRLPEFLSKKMGRKVESKEIQVLAAMRNGDAGIDNLNIKLQNALNPNNINKKPEIKFDRICFRVGDKVMHTANNYQLEWKKVETVNIDGKKTSDETGSFSKNQPTKVTRIVEGTGVFNGDIGIVKHISPNLADLTVLFDDGREVVYARTNLIELTLAYAVTIHKSQGSEFDFVVIPVVGGAPTILTKNLLYTAVTRAKQFVMLVGSRKNISYMVHNNYSAKRFSALMKLLVDKRAELTGLFGA
jgi:exodeoxyribonuclease V alpha subunit